MSLIDENHLFPWTILHRDLLDSRYDKKSPNTRRRATNDIREVDRWCQMSRKKSPMWRKKLWFNRAWFWCPNFSHHPTIGDVLYDIISPLQQKATGKKTGQQRRTSITKSHKPKTSVTQLVLRTWRYIAENMLICGIWIFWRHVCISLHIDAYGSVQTEVHCWLKPWGPRWPRMTSVTGYALQYINTMKSTECVEHLEIK